MSGLDAGGRMAFRASRLQDLTRLVAFLENACAGIAADARADVRLATEEVFANIFKYGYRSQSGAVDIRVSRAPGRITVVIADEAPAFDPASAPAPDLDSDWRDRNVGGLGWHLVRSVMDEVGWEPGAQCGNAYRLVKHVAECTTGFLANTERGKRT